MYANTAAQDTLEKKLSLFTCARKSVVLFKEKKSEFKWGSMRSIGFID